MRRAAASTARTRPTPMQACCGRARSDPNPNTSPPSHAAPSAPTRSPPPGAPPCMGSASGSGWEPWQAPRPSAPPLGCASPRGAASSPTSVPFSACASMWGGISACRNCALGMAGGAGQAWWGMGQALRGTGQALRDPVRCMFSP